MPCPYDLTFRSSSVRQWPTSASLPRTPQRRESVAGANRYVCPRAV